MKEMALTEFKQPSRGIRLFQTANGVEPTTITAETRLLTNRSVLQSAPGYVLQPIFTKGKMEKVKYSILQDISGQF